jgi:hypothetical protein
MEIQKPKFDIVETINLVLKHIDTDGSSEGNGVFVSVAECDQSIEPDIDVSDMECLYPLILHSLNTGEGFIIEDEDGGKHRVTISKTAPGAVHTVREAVDRTL